MGGVESVVSSILVFSVSGGMKGIAESIVAFVVFVVFEIENVLSMHSLFFSSEVQRYARVMTTPVLLPVLFPGYGR